MQFGPISFIIIFAPAGRHISSNRQFRFIPEPRRGGIEF